MGCAALISSEDLRAAPLSLSVMRGLEDGFKLFMQFSRTDGKWLGCSCRHLVPTIWSRTPCSHSINDRASFP